MTPQEREEEELLIEAIDYAIATTQSVALKFLRGVAMAVVAVVLSAIQSHTDYPEWLIGMLVFAISFSRTYRWVAKALIIWLAVLCLVPPSMLAWFSGPRS
ncbi:hypothetical protein OIU35_31495 [Boseaceae bacterium BT-24-1]|nr:hypothetical protein [Boseaceae bacterium BT-24-1]